MAEDKDDEILEEMENESDPDEEVLQEMEEEEKNEETEQEESQEEPEHTQEEPDEDKSGKEDEDEADDEIEELADEEGEAEEEKEPGIDRKIGHLSIDLDPGSSTGDVLVYRVEAEVKGEKVSFELPRYDTHLGWIETFGVPPFNQWVLLRDFNYLNKNFSGDLEDTQYSESVEVEEKGVSGYRINLQRTSGSEEEYYNTRVTDTPGENGKISLTECISSKGVYTATIREKSYENVKPEGIPGLTDYERNYIEDIVEREGDPDVMTLKQAKVDGPIPAIYREMFPFWETEEFDEKPLRAVEIGYLDRGDNEEDVDQKHGDWFKLFSFKGFDHQFLEIREGNWTSREIELEGEEVRTKQHYEKKLYEYEPELEDDE